MGIDRERLVAFYMAALVTIIVVGTLIIFHEMDSGIKAILDAITGHHWLTKSVLVIVLFPLLSAAFYYLLGREGWRRRFRTKRIMGWTLAVVAVTLFFSLGSFLYYVLHFLGVF